MNLTRIFAVAITLGVLSTASSGQETKQQPAVPEAAKPTPSQPAAAPPGGATQQSPETPPAPPSASKPKTGIIKDDEFIPTQEINPDEDVTFPVDI